MSKSKNGNCRVFLIYCEDINSKTCHSSVKLRESDKIYIFTNNKIPELAENFVDFFRNKQEFVDLKKEEILDFLRAKQENGKECYYFIGPHMEEIYNDIGNEVILFAKGIAKNETFGVSKLPLQMAKQGEMSNMDNPFGAIAEALSSAIIESNTDTEPRTQSIPKIKKPLKTINEGREKKPNVTTKIEEKNKEEPINVNLTLPQPKKEIKDTLNVSAECNRAKGRVVYCLMERFKEHLSVAITRQLETDQCYNFLLLLLKSDTPESFTDSWKCEEPEIQVKLSNDLFIDLKGEAIYYYKLSKFFYEDDLWDY